MSKTTAGARDIELDAALVLAGMQGGFHAVCAAAMRLGIKGGPDAVIRHADGLKRAGSDYIKKVADRAAEMERAALAKTGGA